MEEIIIRSWQWERVTASRYGHWQLKSDEDQNIDRVKATIGGTLPAKFATTGIDNSVGYREKIEHQVVTSESSLSTWSISSAAVTTESLVNTMMDCEDGPERKAWGSSLVGEDNRIFDL